MTLDTSARAGRPRRAEAAAARGRRRHQALPRQGRPVRPRHRARRREHLGRAAPGHGHRGRRRERLGQVDPVAAARPYPDRCTSGKLLLRRQARSTCARRPTARLPAGGPAGAAGPVRLAQPGAQRALHPRAGRCKIHGKGGDNLEEAILNLLRRVNLEPAEQFINKYPHELSGGQRQRVSIARGLAVEPKVLLADEPVSMLDVSIRLGVLNLLADLRDRERLAILYVTHDIASARYLADTIMVMYAGKVVESGPADADHQRPRAPVHPAAAQRGAGPVHRREAVARRRRCPALAGRRRRPAAGSTPDARTPCRSARHSCPRPSRSRAGTARRAGCTALTRWSPAMSGDRALPAGTVPRVKKAHDVDPGHGRRVRPFGVTGRRASTCQADARDRHAVTGEPPTSRAPEGQRDLVRRHNPVWQVVPAQVRTVFDRRHDCRPVWRGSYASQIRSRCRSGRVSRSAPQPAQAPAGSTAKSTSAGPAAPPSDPAAIVRAGHVGRRPPPAPPHLPLPRPRRPRRRRRRLRPAVGGGAATVASPSLPTLPISTTAGHQADRRSRTTRSRRSRTTSTRSTRTASATS